MYVSGRKNPARRVSRNAGHRYHAWTCIIYVGLPPLQKIASFWCKLHAVTSLCSQPFSLSPKPIPTSRPRYIPSLVLVDKYPLLSLSKRQNSSLRGPLRTFLGGTTCYGVFRVTAAVAGGSVTGRGIHVRLVANTAVTENDFFSQGLRTAEKL